MTAQTSYSRDPAAATAGQLGDAGPHRIASRYNAEATNQPAGIFMKQGIEGAANLLSAATDKLAGIVLNTFARDPGGLSGTLSSTDAYLPKTSMPMLEEGSAWVRCEVAMGVTDPVYVRFATGTGTQIGAIRKTADGVAQVSTGTPTAAQNSTIFVIRVKFANESYVFEAVSDGSMTATEVVTAFKTVMAADTAFSARVVASGTATLILTGQVLGEAFTPTSEGDGALTWAATTPPAATCRLVRGARVDTPSTAAGVCKLVFSGSADNASL